MQTDQHTEETLPPDNGRLAEQQQLVEAGQRHPAMLPPDSQAALSQQLERSLPPPEQGLFYPMAQHPRHPLGWRVRRHVKRQRFRRAMTALYTAERRKTHAVLPLAFVYASIAMVILIIAVSASGFIGATYKRYGTASATLQDLLPKDNLKIYDSQHRLIYQMTDQGIQTSLPLAKISPHLVQAEIATEDQNFYKNDGYDITGIVRAAISDLTEGHVVSGGSTITQQLIKNAIVGNQTTALRKLQELILAPDVSRRYTKEQVMEMYLNTAYYGEQSYGAEAAAFTYFGLKDTPRQTAAQQLDLAQAAMLAGIPSSPIARDPYLHPHAAHVRVTEVLQRMYVQGFITADERDAALSETLQPNFLHPGVMNNRLAPHYTNYVLRELARIAGVKIPDLSRTGLKIQTALDLGAQNKILLDAQQHIATLAHTHNMSDAAVVVIDNHTGNVRAIVGNIDPDSPVYGDFDVATQGYRQPGSSFKPYIYATAFDMGISPGATVMDGPLAVHMCCGLPAYIPRNYDLRYHGVVTYRYALQNSFNIPAVKLLMRVGVDRALQTALNLGIGSYTGTPNYTMVLGSLGVHLIDNTAAYSTFANGGIRVTPHAILSVQDQNNKVIYRAHFPGKRVLSEAAAFMITDVLRDNQSRVFEFGRCSSLLLYANTVQQCNAGNPGLIRPSAAKTGTSNDFRDNWTMGYTPDFTVGVWAGNNDNSEMVNVSGVDGAGPIWHDTMLLLEQGRPIRDFPGPPPTVARKTTGYGKWSTSDWYKR